MAITAPSGLQRASLMCQGVRVIDQLPLLGVVLIVLGVGVLISSTLATIKQGIKNMSQPVTDTKAAVDALSGKVDAFMAAVTPAIANIQAQLTAAQQQLANGSPSPADLVVLQTTIADAQAEGARVDAAIAALSPATPAPAAV